VWVLFEPVCPTALSWQFPAAVTLTLPQTHISTLHHETCDTMPAGFGCWMETLPKLTALIDPAFQI